MRSADPHLGLLRGLGPGVGASDSLLLLLLLLVPTPAAVVEDKLEVVVDLMVVVVVDVVVEEGEIGVVSGEDMRFQSSWDLQVVGAVFGSDVVALRNW